MTPQQKQEVKAYINSLVEFVHKNEKIMYLKERWLDEREYEDWKGYEDLIKDEFVNGGHEFVRANRSFAMVVRKYGYLIEVKLNVSSITAKVLKK
jgi:hypothetical protein